jgi:hypothetical protein
MELLSNHVDLHVTRSSACTYDAADLGIRTLLVDAAERFRFGDLERTGDCALVGSAAEVLRELKSEVMASEIASRRRSFVERFEQGVSTLAAITEDGGNC